MHISSLPSAYGIGTFGLEARRFVDFLCRSGQSYWQILPLCQTSFGDSPYQSFSSFAGNPYFIDLDYLKDDGLLEAEDYEDADYQSTDDSIDYGRMYAVRYAILKKAVANFVEGDSYWAFLKKNAWVNDYALFMAIKDHFGGCAWSDWPEEYRFLDKKAIALFKKEHDKEIRFWKVIQHLFYKQWFSLKNYANERGIQIIGDCPIYVAYDSVDCWKHPELFQLNKKKIPTKVAGCPPDYFSELGQLWGNPLYKWKNHEKDDFAWWKKRVKFLCQIYDVLRIDHFRGIEAYYAIPFGRTDAKIGKWVKGPDMKLINALKKVVKDEQIIAEDLGQLTDATRLMLSKSGYPGMKVMEFAFGSGNQNEHLPYNIPYNFIVYLGTHDNEPIKAWIRNERSYEEQKFIMDCLDIEEIGEDFNWKMIRYMLSCGAKLTIVQAQDLLGLGMESRMNEPNTLGSNWKWRARKNDFDEALADKLRYITYLYGRD